MLSYLLLFDLFKLTPLINECMAATFSSATCHMLDDMSVVNVQLQLFALCCEALQAVMLSPC